MAPDLTCFVNGGCLVEPLDRLTPWHGKVAIPFAKDPLGSGSSSFGVPPQCHHPVHLVSLVILSSNKTKRMFEPRTHYCHIHLACTSVWYERKIHVLVTESKIAIVKKSRVF